MSGNGMQFSEFKAGGVLPTPLPTATDAGPAQMGMQAGAMKGGNGCPYMKGGKSRRKTRMQKGCGKKKGGKSKKNRKTRCKK
jgi:hypothetical protein